MKKKLALLLATLMCISLCACGGTESTSANNKKEESGFTPVITTEEEKTEEIVDEIDKDNLEKYYDTTQFVGTPRIEDMQISWKEDKKTVEIGKKNKETLEWEVFCVIEKPKSLTGMGSKHVDCIFVDNNTPDDKSDDVIAYIFLN